MKNHFLLFIGLLFLLPHIGNWAADFENIPKLTVRGEASVFKPSDQMEVLLGVITQGKTASQASNENRQRMQQVIANLKAIGLDESDYQTGRFYVQPIYQKPQQGAPEDEHGKVSHYEVINGIQIKTKKIGLADKIIEAAVQGGANEIHSVHFSLNNPQSYQEEVIKVAAEYALADANALAIAAGVNLKRILNLTLENWRQFPNSVAMLNARSIAPAEKEFFSNIIEPGKAEIHAAVNITFEISP
jgi:uncharacterized protein YggE